MKVVRIPMSTGRATAAGVVAVVGAAVLWAVHEMPAADVAIGAGFALVLTHTRWKYDPADAYEWGWANAALGMAGGGLLFSGMGGGAGLGVGLALGSAAALLLLPRLTRPREKSTREAGGPD